MYIRHQALLVAHVIVFRLGTVKMFQALRAQSTVFWGASIMPKITEISVRIQMERFVSVSSDRNIRDHLWRWSTYYGRNIPTEIHRSIFDKPVLCPNKGIR